MPTFFSPMFPRRRRHCRLVPIPGLTLPLLAAGAVWLAAVPAHAQSSTLVYGSDTEYVNTYSPSPRYFGMTTQVTGGAEQIGAQGQFVTSYGAAYDPTPVDVSQGFVARFNIQGNGSNGAAFVVKNPSSPDYIRIPPKTNPSDAYPPEPPSGSVYGLGAISYNAATQTATGLRNTLDVAFIAYKQSASNPDNHTDRHYKEVEVFAADASGTPTILADVTGLDISSQPVSPGSNTLQIRYLARFSTLDVYIGPKLIVRVPNVDLTALGVSSGGQAELGFTSGAPPMGNNIDYFPVDLNTFSIGNQLSFGTGFGANYYEDRFPFLATGQSVYSSGSDSVEYKNFLGATSNGQKKQSKTVGIDASPVFTFDTSAFASYDVGLGIDATATGGTADISYPLFFDMVFPAQYSVDAGKTFTLPMAFYPDLTASLKTTSPSANVKASIKCITDFGVNLDASIFGKSITSGNLFETGINIPETTIFDAQQLLSSGLIPDVSGGINYSGYFQGDGAAKGKANTPGDGTPGKGGSDGAGFGKLLTKYVNFGLTIPDLSTSGGASAYGPNGSHLTSSASSPFVTLSSDFTNSVLAEIPGLDILTQVPFFNNDYSLSLGGQTVELGTHFCDIYGSVSLGAAVNYDFTPGPQVYLTLSSTDPNQVSQMGPYALDPATGKLAFPPMLTMPADGSPLTVTPYIVMDVNSKFTTTDSFTLGGSLSINPLSLSFGYNDTKFSTDPAFGFPLSVSGSIPIYTPAPFTFTAGLSSGGAANAVPFQTSITGKSFMLFSTAADNPAIDSVAPASSSVQLAGSSGTLPITIAAEHASINGDVVWDYDGVPTDPQTTLPNRVWSSDTQVSAAVPYSLLTAQGLHTITLINHNDGDAQLFASNLFTFAVNAPAPSLSALSAKTVMAGGPAFTLTVSGASFSPLVAAAGSGKGYPGSVVLWNGKPLLTTFLSAGKLTATVPASLLAAAGTAGVSVFTSGPGGGASAVLPLTIANMAPTLTSLSQTQIGPGLTSLQLTLTGSNFVPGSMVLLGNGPSVATRAAGYVSSTTLTLPLSAGDLSTPGTFIVQVRTPAPGGGVTKPLLYTIGQAPVTGTGIYFVPRVTRGASGYEVHLTVYNTSQTDSVGSILVTAETVGGDSAGRDGIYPSLPAPLQAIVVGAVPAGSSVTPAKFDTFPLSLGASGKAVLLTIQGTAGSRSFTSRLRVVLP